MTQYQPETPTAVGQVSTRLRPTAVPLHDLAETAGDAHVAVHGATAAAGGLAHEQLAAQRRSRAQVRAERLAAIEARNKHGAGTAELHADR